MPEQREGGLLQLLGDHTPPKHQLRGSLPPPHALSHTQLTQHILTQQFQHAHQHQINPDWIASTAPSASPANPADSEPAGASRSSLLDPTQAFSRTATQSPSPQRSLTPDLQLPVVTDASILNLTSLSRGRGLQEVSEHLFGNIKRKYGRKDSQRTLGNPHGADTPWGRQPEKGSESPTNPEEKQKYREETAERFHEEREERRKEERERTVTGRRGDEEDRGMPMLTEEGKGRKRRRRPSFDESFSVEQQLQQRQDSDTTEKQQPGPTEPKVAHKMETHKNDSRLTSHTDVSRERVEKAERADKGDKREKGDRAERGEAVITGSDPESALIANKMKKNSVGRPRISTDTLKHREPAHNHIIKPNLNTHPRLPSPHPNPSPRSSISPSLSPHPRASMSPSPHPRASMSPSLSPRPRPGLSPSPSHSTSSTASSRPSKTKDRWSYLKAKSHASLTSPHRDNRGSPSTLADPPSAFPITPSAFPITPSSPLYTNTDSLTVHTPIKRKRGRPKKQPLLTVETIHEGTSTSPPSPLAQEAAAGLNRRRKTHTLNTLVQMTSATTSANSSSLKLKRGRVPSRPVNKMKLGKMQSILNEILSGSSQNGALALKSSSAPVTSAMSAMASTIEARLGKQINVSKRGTIYIGKKRGRKPRAETQASNPLKTPLFASTHSLYESPVVPSATLSPCSSATSMRTSHSDATMPSLQPILALPSKPPGRSFLSGGWKLSPPRLLANSPSHLSEGASVKEVTLSPISESHSEETIPSDSGIGTDNNSTSDQTEKGPASRRRYSFDLCGFEAAEAAALEASNRSSKARCERQGTAVDNFLSQQEKKQKHNRRKRKCLQSRDHLHFLSELEEVVVKLQQLRVSHRRYTCYPQHTYPSIFRLNFHHYYPYSYDSYPCDSSSYLRRSADLKAKRRRGRPAKASEPITSKLPFVPGYGYPLAGGNYYAAPYAMPYAPPLSLGYFPPATPFYLPHHSMGPAPPSPFMRPAVPPPKAFHTSGHSKLQPGAKLRGPSGPLQGPSVRAEGLGSLVSGNAGGLAGVRLHKRKHKHKHKHKDEPLLSLRDRQELGGLFSGAKTNARLSMLSDRRDLANQGSSKHLEKQRGSGRGPSLGSSLGMFESDQLSTHSLADSQFHSRQTRQPINSFMSSYSSQSQRSESASDLFLGSREDECGGRSRKTRLSVFGDQGLLSFQTARQEPGQMNHCSSPAIPDVPGKRRYKRREVEQIQKDVRRMHSLNFEHVQKILRAKRLQRQAKTGNNVVKRRPGRPRKQPIEECEPPNRRVEARADVRVSDMFAVRKGDGRTLGMPVLERCDDLPGRHSLRPSLTPEPLEFSNHDSISATIETVVHQARSVLPLAKGGKRRGRPHSRDELWAPSNH
ncbi:SET-binding protein-like [Notothenia coriiceps]|uniref:SET-binding protein-like n=1 Tax=Notothenia coriiceps TaxID=8208 RepID=A0A6I9NAR6_9TELE|nr:PREDICTED: SET-binding protein-like [Notothenia coriiceps]